MARMKMKVRGRWQWVELTPELEKLMNEQLESFRKTFGRDPGPGDPIFFDPDSPTPKPYDPEKFHRQMMETFRLAGTPGYLVHAWEKTGLMVSAENEHLLSKKDLREWDAAIEEYFRLHPEERPLEPPPVSAPRRQGRSPRGRRRRGRP